MAKPHAKGLAALGEGEIVHGWALGVGCWELGLTLQLEYGTKSLMERTKTVMLSRPPREEASSISWRAVSVGGWLAAIWRISGASTWPVRPSEQRTQVSPGIASSINTSGSTVS